MDTYAFGVDVGGTEVKIGIFRNHSLLEKTQIPTRTENHGKNILPDIVAVIRADMGKYHITWDTLEGIGMGVRSALEEKYLGECRDHLVAGTFDKFSDTEVTELPNVPDTTNIEFSLDGERFDLTQGKIVSYDRSLDIRTGLLSRDVEWENSRGRKFRLRFERIVSLKRLHTMAMRITLAPETDAEVRITSGIDGRVTNTGTQHFAEGSTRFYEKKYQQYAPVTIQSGIPFVVSATHAFHMDEVPVQPENKISIVPRKMYSVFTVTVPAGKTLVMEKYTNVFTGRDRETEGMDMAAMQNYALEMLKSDEKSGFAALAAESADEWEKKVWRRSMMIG